MNKKILILFLLVIRVASFAEIKVELSPTPLIIGEICQLKLIADSGDDYPVFEEYPEVDGITWHKNMSSQSSSINIINGNYKKSLITICSFTINKSKVILPEFTIVQGNIKKVVKSQILTATKRKFQQRDANGNLQNIDLDKMVFAEISLLNPKNKYYIGEEIEAQINLFYAMNISPQWPEIELENAVFKDFSEINPNNPKFLSQPKEFQKIKNGQQFNVYSFTTIFQFIAKGKYLFNPDVNCQINIPNQNNRRSRFRHSFFDDSFFGRSRYKQIQHKVKVTPLEIVVEELPELDKDTDFLGLIGNWNVTYKLTGVDKDIKEGDSLELNIKVSGDGVIDNLKAPKLKLSKFRAFPAEITKNNNYPRNATGNIKYILMPEDAGDGSISFSCATFSTKEKKYKNIIFNKKINIKANKKSSAIALIKEHNDNETVKKPLKIKKRSDILYLKKEFNGKCSLLLNEKNDTVILIIIGSIILLVFSELLILIFKKTDDEESVRKKNALKNKRNLLKKLKNVSDDEFADLSHSEILPFFNAIYAQPAGTAAGELAEKIDNKELSDILKELDQIGYFANSANKKELKTKMSKMIKKISVFIIALMPFFSTADNLETMQEAMTSYDSGNFEKALELYKSICDSSNPDPNILYNIGNSYFQLNDEMKALICYEQARRLKPRDRDILENTNLIRRKLDLKEVDKPVTPYEYIISFRDNLRPDEWQMIFAISFAGIIFIVIIRRVLNRKIKFALFAVFATIIILSIVAIFAQLNSSFNKNIAFIAVDNLSVYSLPSEQASTVDQNIKIGTEIIIEEKRKKWVFITKNNISGWIKIKDAYQLFEPIN